ncbi:MAG: radical SAM protein [Alphaproteobacteria bacterium]|nr:radical SAM protein [Alphaproteobacteria bacterium]
MKTNIVSLYDNKRWDQYPTTQSLHALRLGAYIRKYRPGYDVVLSAYEMGQSPETIAKDILSTDPQIVALPGYMWTTAKTRAIAEYIERVRQDTIIVCGGPEPTSFKFLPWSDQTLFVAGQGEEAFLWICDQKEKQASFNGQNLGGCPYPVFSKVFDTTDIRNKQLGGKENKVIYLPEGVPLFSDELTECFVEKPSESFSWYETTRGCIYTCSFCGHNTLPRFATFSDDFVIQELQNMSRTGIDHIFINDPILGGKQERGKRVLRLFNQYAPGIALQSYMRPEFLDDEFVDLIAGGNHKEVLIGIQTLNPDVPQHVRNNNLEKIRKYLPMLSERNVPWRAELITGLPGDTINGLRESIRFVIDELRPAFIYSYHLTAIPETKIDSLVDDYQSPHWLKADPKSRRIIASSTANEESMATMLMYSTAACSLYMRLKQKQDRGALQQPITFAEIDRVVSEVLSLGQTEDMQSFLKQDYGAADRTWKKYGYEP